MRREQVMARMRKLQGKQSLRQFAKSIGVSVAYLSDIYRNRRDPGPAILDILKISKRTTVEYEAKP